MLALKSPPSIETAKRLQQAFDIFNNNLFDGQLPDAMLRIERLKNANGIYRPARYSDNQGSTIACIALNSTNANERELPLLLSTLVHEMCHMHVHLIDNEGKATGGHKSEWRKLMVDLGLDPIKVGSTWRQATHSINPDGRFIRVYNDHRQRLEALPWKELANDPELSGRARGLDKVKFTCPSCGSRAWARSAAQLNCGTCSTATEPVRMIPEYRAEGGGGKGSAQRATAKPQNYEPPSTTPWLPVWTDDLGRELRLLCGIDHPPQTKLEAAIVMLFGVKLNNPALFEAYDKTVSQDNPLGSLELRKQVYKHRAKRLHPDMEGGSEVAFKALQIASRILDWGKE